MKIMCVSCNKQAVRGPVSEYDAYLTTQDGARAGFRSDECYCGHCASEMDENGLFPEELMLVESTITTI